MDCREFRNRHVAYVDDLLPVVEMHAMARHLNHCSGCSRQDTRIRRSLMLVRSLPPVDVSPAFMARLNERLADIGPVSREDYLPRRTMLPSLGSVAALAAGLAAVAYMSIETSRYFAPALDVQAATASSFAVADAMPTPMANAALVAAVPTGIPVWPAVLMAGQAPIQFASMEFRDTEQAR